MRLTETAAVKLIVIGITLMLGGLLFGGFAGLAFHLDFAIWAPIVWGIPVMAGFVLSAVGAFRLVWRNPK